MVIQQIELYNYRNYTRLEAQFSPNINVIIGNNGQGKTNLVEALFYVCNLDSFRTHKVSQLIQNNNEFAGICAKVCRKSVCHSIKIVLTPKGKQVLVDNSPSRKVSEYVLSFFAIPFTPDDVQLFKGPPQDRRRFLDRVLSFIQKVYFQDLQEYSKVLVQKNALLKQKKNEQIGIWNQLLSQYGHRIVEQRLRFVEELNKNLSSICQKITGRRDNLELYYHPSIAGDEKSFNKSLEEVKERELRYGYSLLGPHRDDYYLKLDNKLDREYFSQGELRITNLSLKMAINQLLSSRDGFHPVLIFDDMLSELDDNVSRLLLSYCSGLKNQIFVTSTALPQNMYSAKIFHVSDAKVTINKSI
ncbi:DNA replication/repair protein RecF [Deltaproteobacteria bacterium TL4]